jgi:26S proteasome regulatory subunit T1
VPAANIDRVFAYAFTTAGRGASEDADTGGGPYAAQHIGGSAAFDADATGGSLFADIASQGLQTGMGTIAGLGFGLPMSRLYSK